MNLSAIESLRHSLIATQLCTDPSLRRLALCRYDEAEGAIAALPREQQCEPHAVLMQMLPSDWPLWVERSLSRAYAPRM